MDAEFYSIEDVTTILKLHPKTILRFIHEGKIKAQKMGRSWRITKDALKEYAHSELAVPAQPKEPVNYGSIHDRIKVSAIIEINEQNSEEASRLSNTIMAALNCKDPAWGNSRVDFFYYPEIQKAKYAIYGNPAFIVEIMTMFDRLSIIERNDV